MSPRWLPLLALAGCASSSSASSPPPCKLEGIWSIHYNRDSQNGGTCVGGPDAFDDVVTITQDPNDPGSAEMQFQGSTGACTAIVEQCSLTTKCNGSSSVGLETRQDSWRFSGNSVGGSSFFGFPLTNGSGDCSYNAVLSGTRK